jgi:hypothetical protein
MKNTRLVTIDVIAVISYNPNIIGSNHLYV